MAEIELLGGAIERFSSRDLKKKPQLAPIKSAEQSLALRWG
jgi:hypothetical protein